MKPFFTADKNSLKMSRRKFVPATAACGAVLVSILLFLGADANAQKPQAVKVEPGSNTGKNGFKNEDAIGDKFNNWRNDDDARAWLSAMNHKLTEIDPVVAKPLAKKHESRKIGRITMKRKGGDGGRETQKNAALQDQPGAAI